MGLAALKLVNDQSIHDIDARPKCPYRAFGRNDHATHVPRKLGHGGGYIYIYIYIYSQGFAPAAGPLDIQCWIADLKIHV